MCKGLIHRFAERIAILRSDYFYFIEKVKFLSLSIFQSYKPVESEFVLFFKMGNYFYFF